MPKPVHTGKASSSLIAWYSASFTGIYKSSVWSVYYPLHPNHELVVASKKLFACDEAMPEHWSQTTAR